MLKKARICNQCYAKPTCFAFHKLVDDGDGDTSGMGNAFTDFVDHLTPSHQTFFRKWETLLTAEEKDMMRFRRELWTMIGSEREAVGRCFSNIVIEPGSAFEDKDAPKINRFRYTFVKQNAPHGFSFGDSQITVGEPIVVSDEKGHFALAMGFVVQVSRRRITVSVNRKLHDARTKAPAFDADRNQAFTGIMEIVEDEAGRPSTIHPAAAEDTIVYRLDKDEFSNGMATARNNLVRLMDKDLFQASRLRELIVDCAAPSFRPPSAVPILPAASYSGLNVDQKRALDKVMSADDYALVLGMPGTGKTTTIAQIIRAIVSQGKTVLLTSYTHTAVDNILLKIQDDNIRTLRIGALSKVHPDVRKFADLTGVPKKTIEELQDSYEKSVVVATTCLGVNHPIFHHRTFDYCIVDEASQITLPVCLGPIRMAKTFILVGDHHQLPPLVQSKEAGGGGLDISLFKLLCDAQPSSVVNLEHQYRMCEEIMLLSNTLIYSGALKCGTPAVASRSLDIPDINALKRHHANPLAGSPSRVHSCMGPTFGQCWLRDLLDSSAKARLVNTDQLHPAAVEVANGSRIVNSIEAAICTQLVEALISTGIPAREIGVVTLYRSQLALLRQNLRHRLPDLEMHTADRFQGRDKEVIIMSCVRSNSERNVGDLLRDRRRVNVAFTRARTKMLIVGSKTTLSQGNELLNKFVKLMEVKGWCYDLPPRAVEGHVFEDLDAGVSQTSPVVHRKTVRFGSPLKKNAFSPGKKQRLPLSPVKNRQSTVAGIRKPEKFGGRLMDAGKILSKRPVLADVLNDMLG
jgi:DNA replication ATP-dependent helicase Dna2